MADGVSLAGDDALDVSKLKVAELKKELKNRGLSTAGNKNELMERLQLSLQGEGALMMEPDLGAADAEEILDEDEVLAEEEALDDDLGDITTKSDDILPSLDESTEKAKTSETEEKAHAPKKIVLNRSTVVTGKENQKEPVNEEKKEERKVIKLSELTAKERLEMRARKFGLPVSSDAKKEARAARFGVTSTGSGSTSSTTTTTTAASGAGLDVLKKRAERFGASVSSALSKVELEEKLKKRQERFGSTESPVPAKKPNVTP